MGFFASLVDAFRSKPRSNRESIPLESPRRERQVFQESSNRYNGGQSSKTVISGPATDRSDSTYAAMKRRSMSRRRSWFGGRPDADEDVPAVPTLVRTDYNGVSGIKSPTLGRSSRSNGADYYQLPEDKRDRRASHRQNATAIGALPPLPSIPIVTGYVPPPATSTLPDEQRRSRRQSMKSLHRSNSQASTKSRRKSRSFWASSNPDDDDEDVPPVPVLASPSSIRNDPFEEQQQRSQSRGRARSSTHGDGAREPRPVSTASRRSYVPRSAAAGFLKSTNGASEDQRKSYRRSFNLGEGVDLVCVTNEHQVEWEKLMNKNARLEDALFASMGRNSDEETGDRHSNAQALAALEFGVRA